VRPRIIAFVALLGAAAAVLGARVAPRALAASAEVKLQVNQNCVEPNWPCWTAETSGSYPRTASRVTILDGGEVAFVEHDPSTAAGVNWIGGGAAPACTGVPTTATLDWEGSCKFEQPGTYMFESATMFEDAYENYKKYEIVVEGPPPPPAAPKVSTLAASEVKETQATLNGRVDPEGGAAAEYFFEWGAGSGGPYEHTTNAVSLPSDRAEHQVSATATGLVPGGEYHFRIVAKNELGSVQGEDLTFMATATTPPAKEPTKEPPAQEPTKEPAAKEPSPTSTPTGGNSTATASSSPASEQPEAATAPGPPFASLELASTQHSFSVRGALDISQAGAGGRLAVTLLAGAAPAKAGHSAKVRVGRLLRSSLRAGPVSFAVPLAAKTRAALRRRRRLELTVQIVIAPIHGAAVTVTRSVVLRG
jgi:hypothetical protein